MHLIDPRLLGSVILFLLAMLVAVKRITTGSILEKPSGSFLLRLVNSYNLFFLLLVIPAAAVLLFSRRLPAVDPAHVAVVPPWLLTAVEIIGLWSCVAGFLLMAWALIALKRNYQLGGCSPRPGDSLIANGPYSRIRHPMYSSALAISLGLALLVQSGIFLGVFAVYLALVLVLIPVEERTLLRAYGESYAAYREGKKKLIPFVY